MPITRFDSDRDHRALRAVLHSIVEERPHDLLRSVRIGDDEMWLASHGQLEWAIAPQRSPSPFAQGLKCEYFLARRNDAGLEPRRDQELADHPTQPLGLVGDRLQIGVRGRGHAISRAQLGSDGRDAGQRRLEVVRDPAEEICLDGSQAVELIRLRPHARVQE